MITKRVFTEGAYAGSLYIGEWQITEYAVLGIVVYRSKLLFRS